MPEAKISEIFLSYQGEGPFTGSRQLFVRFYGCNIKCAYCDTSPDSYKSFTREGLLGKVLDFDDDYNEFTLTGGEPLVHAGFLEGFLPLFRKHRKHRIYLETNGTLPEELSKVLAYVDIISMDIKLPSSSFHGNDLWPRHRAFLDVAKEKELMIKAVITDGTTMDDIKMMADVVAEAPDLTPVTLQPVTPSREGIREPDAEMIEFFKGHLIKATGKSVAILGQVHKCMGIR